MNNASRTWKVRRKKEQKRVRLRKIARESRRANRG